MQRIAKLDEIDEPCARRYVEHMLTIDPNYGSQEHQLRFVERLAEFQRRQPCPGGKITCRDGWHTTGGVLVELQGGKRKVVYCYDPDMMKAVSQEQYLRDKP